MKRRRGQISVNEVLRSHSRLRRLEADDLLVREAMQKNAIVDVVKLGFNSTITCELVRQKLERDGTEFTSVEAVLEELLAREGNREAVLLSSSSAEGFTITWPPSSDVLLTSDPCFSSSPSRRSSNDSGSPVSAATSRVSHSFCNNENRCRVCRETRVDCLVLRCHHLCSSCAFAVLSCPICGAS